MALLSPGKCGGNDGGNGNGSSPPPQPSVRNMSGGINTAGLLPPAMYCPMLPPWHLALLTHHALHARGLGMGTNGASPYLPLPPVFNPVALPPGGGRGILSRAHLPLHSITQSQETNTGIRDRDLAPSPTSLASTTGPLLPPRPQQPRIRSSFTIADLLGSSDDTDQQQESTQGNGSDEGVVQGYDDQDHIDPGGGGGTMEDSAQMSPNSHEAPPGTRFQWLQCTRYHPPKLPRVKRREGGQKRKLGRNPRVPFSSTQLAALEARFNQSQYLSSCDVADLSALLNLTETRVKIWFQNRRARERRDREARAKGLLPPSSSSSASLSSTSSSSSSVGGNVGPLPPSAFALYQFTAALAPGSASAFTPVMPRPPFDAPPLRLPDSSSSSSSSSSCDPPATHDDSVLSPPTMRDVNSLHQSSSSGDACRKVSPHPQKVNSISMDETPDDLSQASPGRTADDDCEMRRSPPKKVNNNNMVVDTRPESP